MKIEVTQAALDDKSILRQMMELYSYDFSEYEDTDLDEHGCFGYPWLDHYWTEKGRYPFLVRVDGKLAGFVLVNQYTYLSDSEWAIAEFFIMQKYRAQGIGRYVAFFIFDRFRGKWEVHEIENNISAQIFWRKVISEYTGGQYNEIRWNDGESKGPIQFFQNSDADKLVPSVSPK